jgi:excisionase family DNA binding protein
VCSSDLIAEKVTKMILSKLEKHFTAPDRKNYLSKKEAVQFLKVSPVTIHNLMKDGKIPFIKNGRKVLFELQDLENYLESKRICRDQTTNILRNINTGLD